MNKIILVGLILTTAVGVQAQTLKDAKKKVDNELYEAAKTEYKSLIQKDPANVENIFFYGNLLAKLEDNQGAIEQYKLAASKNAEDKLAMVSGAKAIYFAGDTATAGTKFREIIKSTKNKNVCVLMSVAETYATGPVKNYATAEKLLNRVVELEPNNVEALQLLGDVIINLTTSRVSEAVGKYNEVLKLEPTNANAIVKKAYIYERVGNVDAAIEGYEQAIKIDPTFGPAYRFEAEAQMTKGNYDKSAALWTKYLSLNNDPEARYRYAASLFVGKKYDLVIPELQTLEKNGISNEYTKRMTFYSMYEMNTTGDVAQYEKALAVANDYFKVMDPKKVIYTDYQYLANIYLKLGKTAEAYDALARLATLKPEAAAEQFSTIGTTAFKAKDYKGAIAAYSKKKEVLPQQMKTNDYYELGKSYYFDTPADFTMADTSFAMVTVLSPTYPMGYIWRGRALSQMDLNVNNRNWKAQPAYQTFMDKLTDADKANAAYKDYITEASRYLGDYYVNSPMKDAAKAKMYWQQVLTNDPNDPQAKIYFKNH